MPVITIYTDGSCHTQLLIGTWAAIVLIEDKKIILKGREFNTTHNRMELFAVIRAVEFLEELKLTHQKIVICSDSQYVVNLSGRMEKLEKNSFMTKAGKVLQNTDLLRRLIKQMKSYNLNFTKIKAHQKGGDAFNKEADLIVRNLLRENIVQ